jgi:hypothetical protein
MLHRSSTWPSTCLIDNQRETNQKNITRQKNIFQYARFIIFWWFLYVRNLRINKKKHCKKFGIYNNWMSITFFRFWISSPKLVKFTKIIILWFWYFLSFGSVNGVIEDGYSYRIIIWHIKTIEYTNWAMYLIVFMSRWMLDRGSILLPSLYVNMNYGKGYHFVS